MKISSSILSTPGPVIIALTAALLFSGCSRKEERKETDPPVSVRPAGTPDVLPNVLKIKLRDKTYVITGIGLGVSNKVAIINNEVLKPGMEIDPGVVLEDIQPTFAIIRVGNTQHLIRPEDIQRELDKKKQ